MSTDNTLMCLFGILAFIAFLMMTVAGWLKDHESCKPEIRPQDAEDGPLSDEETKVQDISQLRQMVAPGACTTRQCKNPKCQRVVSYKKLTGDYCAYCHIEHAPKPEIGENKGPITAIPSEVKDHD